MKLAALLSAVITAALLAATTLRSSPVALGALAIACGVVWIIILLTRTGREILNVVLAIEAGIAIASVLYGGSVYVMGVTIVLAIMAWDFALTEASISSFPAKMRRAFAVRHITQMTIIPAVALSLMIIPLQLRISIGFRSSLGLGLGGFVLLSLLLWMLRGPSEHERREHHGLAKTLSVLGEAMGKEKTGSHDDRPSDRSNPTS